jgi:hypothetical protein
MFSYALNEDEAFFEKTLVIKSRGVQNKLPKAINLTPAAIKSAEKQSKIVESGKTYCMV